MNVTATLIKRLQFTTTYCISRQILQENDSIFSVPIFFYVTTVKTLPDRYIPVWGKLTASVEDET